MKKRIFTTLITIFMAVALVVAMIPALSVTTNAASTYTWEIPIEITVTNGGTTEASAISFGLLLYDLGGSEIDLADFNGAFLQNSQYVYTTGHGTYYATLRFQGGDQLKQHLADGFIVCLNDIGVDGWTHNNVEYEVVSCTFNEAGEMTEISIESVNTGYSVSGAAFECEYTGWYLRFETNGGSTIDPVAAADGTTIDLSGYTPTRDGYSFTGWFSDGELTTKVSSVTFDADTDVAVYAGWEKCVTVGAMTLADGQYTTDGTDINDGEPTGTSYAYYSDGMLTLSNFSYEVVSTIDSRALIQCLSGDLTVKLIGENKIGGETYGIYAYGSVTITGTGGLEINAAVIDNWGGTAIMILGNVGNIDGVTLAIDGVTLVLNASDDAIFASSGNIAIQNEASVTATGRVSAAYSITIKDSSLSVDNTNNQSVVALSANNITIEDSYVSAVASDAVAIAGSYGVAINGESEVIADGGIESNYGNIVITPAAGETLEFRISNSAYVYKYVTEEYTYYTGTFSAHDYVSISLHTHAYENGTCATCGAADPDATTASTTTSSTQSTSLANYSAVSEAIAKANALNPDDYEDFSAVKRAITNVDWTLTSTNQSAVNSMAAAINEAIANLVPVSTVEVVVDEPVEGTDIEIEE